MASAITDYLEDALLDHVMGVTQLASGTTVYAGLCSANPTDTGAVGEIAGGAYARTALTFGSASTGGTITNTADTTFPTATASWGTITHSVIWDASTGGNALFQGALASSKAVGNGDTFKFASGNVSVTLD